MTSAEFLAFYPQFAAVSDVVIEEYTKQSNERFGDFADAAEEARRLYIAHKLTLYAQSYAEYSAETPTAIALKRLAGAGVAAQQLSKSVGGVSVSKSEGSAISGISGYGEYKTTAYGLQLIGLAKIATAGGKYIP